MVSRSPRPRGRSHCGGIRRRRGIDRDSHSLRDRQLRLQHGLSLVWNCPRRHRIHARFVAAWAGAKRDGRGANAESHAIDAQFFAKGSTALAGILAALHHVRDGIGLRADGDGANCANRV
jgi:hypothetical protein